MPTTEPPARSTPRASPRRRRELARADRVLPGLWRLRLPLPMLVVPHANAYAITAGSGIVLVDCGMAEPGAPEQLQRALEQAGAGLEHVRLLVCTHAHPDHYGLAAEVVEASGCELWMHGAHAHATETAGDPDGAFEVRLEKARRSGVPDELLAAYEDQQRGTPTGIGRVVLPDREIVAGDRVETDLGVLEVHEAPGHAPSHVVLHEPERGLLLSGDHLLGRISLYYDHGWTPDPVGEFLASLERVEALDARLCLSGHGRPFRDVRAHVLGTRRRVAERIALVRTVLERGAATPYECVPALLDTPEPPPGLLNWGLTEALCYLTHMEAEGEVRRTGEEPVERWELV